MLGHRRHDSDPRVLSLAKTIYMENLVLKTSPMQRITTVGYILLWYFIVRAIIVHLTNENDEFNNKKGVSEVGFEPTPTFVDQNTHFEG